MKFLFVTYCFGAWNGQALIGVYKRGLRCAMELKARGHEVVFICTGREAYHDQLTREAERQLEFVDLAFSVEALEAAEEIRRQVLAEVALIAPDVVVVGESPLAGAMMEVALCTVELEILLVILDNAYNSYLVDRFCSGNGPIADGIVLTGPSSFHSPDPPNFLCQLPAFVDVAAPEAIHRLLDEQGLTGDKLIVVLAYDDCVEQLGISLLSQLERDEAEALFLSRDPDRCRERLLADPVARRRMAAIQPVPSDRELFGLIETARLAICKYGFMQVSECLSLATPIIAFYYEGPQWLDLLPEVCRTVSHVTSEAEATPETVAVARRLIAMGPEAMSDIHSGGRKASERAADFLEAMPRAPRQETWADTERLGITEDSVSRALSTYHQGREVRLVLMRSMRSRDLPECSFYNLVCGYELDDERRFARLWVRIYDSRGSATRDLKAARTGDPDRRVLYFSAERRLMVELDLGQARLPPL